MNRRIGISLVCGLMCAFAATRDAAAQLTITFNGPCPGPVAVDATGAEPLAVIGLVYASCRGSYVIQAGGCAGTELGLCRMRLQLLQTGTSDGLGNITFSAIAPSSVCNGWVQVVDGSTCEVSNVARVI